MNAEILSKLDDLSAAIIAIGIVAAGLLVLVALFAYGMRMIRSDGWSDDEKQRARNNSEAWETRSSRRSYYNPSAGPKGPLP